MIPSDAVTLCPAYAGQARFGRKVTTPGEGGLLPPFAHPPAPG